MSKYSVDDADKTDGPGHDIADCESFAAHVVTELAQSLQSILGQSTANLAMSSAATTISHNVTKAYQDGSDTGQLTLDQVRDALIDLSKKVGGSFEVESFDEQQIKLIARSCPFGKSIAGKPALCMITSNVFGRMVADNLGYARVELQNTLADGDRRCRVVIHLTPDDSGLPSKDREYRRAEMI